MPTLETYKGEYIWQYVPNLPAAIAFTLLFAVASAAHTWKMIRSKMWFCLPFVVGGLCEVLGFATRAVAVRATGSLVPFLMQAIFLVLPPVFFAASLYMVYSRVVRAVHGEALSPLTPRRTTVIFVLGDLLCMNIQSTGSSLLGKAKTTDLGNHIIVAGLGMQVVMFAVFMAICIIWNRRFRSHIARAGNIIDIPWQSCLNMLYTTSLAILVRNIYRIAEFVIGKTGYLQVNEWPAYVFDAALMLLVMAGFFVWYPSELRPVARDSMVELLSAPSSPSRERAGTVTRSETDQREKASGLAGGASNSSSI